MADGILSAAARHAVNMTLAYVIARGSKDTRTKVGAIVIGPDNEIRSAGHNGFPRGLDDDVEDRLATPEKHYWFEHAERNAIYNAARMGLSLKGCVMFTQGLPCVYCARAIVQAGIVKVVIHKPWNDLNTDPQHRTMEMFAECGVEIEEWAGALLSVIGWRDGQQEDSVTTPDAG